MYGALSLALFLASEGAGWLAPVGPRDCVAPWLRATARHDFPMRPHRPSRCSCHCISRYASVRNSHPLAPTAGRKPHAPQPNPRTTLHLPPLLPAARRSWPRPATTRGTAAAAGWGPPLPAPPARCHSPGPTHGTFCRRARRSGGRCWRTPSRWGDSGSREGLGRAGEGSGGQWRRGGIC